jgi:hypothetical protein
VFQAIILPLAADNSYKQTLGLYLTHSQKKDDHVVHDGNDAAVLLPGSSRTIPVVICSRSVGNRKSAHGLGC